MAFHHWMSTQSAHQNLRGHGRQAGRPVSLAHIEREIADMIAKENDAHAPRVQKIDACWEANEDPNAHLTGSPLDMLICSSWLMHSSIPSTIIFPGLPGKPVLLVLLIHLVHLHVICVGRQSVGISVRAYLAIKLVLPFEFV